MRPLLPLAAFLVALAPCARAQNRVGTVEVGVEAPGAQSGSLTSSLTPGGVPQIVTLNLAVPSLTASPGLTPLALAPTPLRAAAPYAAEPSALIPSAAPLPAPLAESAIAPVVAIKPLVVMKQAPDRATEGASGGKSLSGLIASAKRLFDGTSGSGSDDALPPLGAMTKNEGAPEKGGRFKSAYLRRDAPFPFDAAASARYEEAVGRGTTDDGRAKAILDAAETLLASAGVVYTRVERVDETRGRVDGLVITPLRDGGPLNRLAWNLQKRHGTAVEYSPKQLGYGANAGFVTQRKTLYLPHFGSEDTYGSVLHEAQHSWYADRRAKGDLSPFHAQALARVGQTIVPRASHYASQMSMEELTTQAKGFKMMLADARRTEPTATQAYNILLHAYQLQDLRRSAAILASRIVVELEKGAELRPVTDEETLAILGPIGNGSWSVISLPWSVVYLPVLDEAPATPRKGLAALFARKQPSPAQKAARRTAASLTAWAAETGEALDDAVVELERLNPDWKKVNASADKIALAGPKAERVYSAQR